MKIELPFDFTTLPMKTYQYQAYSSGILLSSKKDKIIDWLVCHSLKLLATDEVFYVYYPGDCPNLFQELKFQIDDCFDRHCLDMPSFYLLTYKSEILQILHNMLSEKFYIHGDWNEFYIPNRFSYRNKKRDHDYLLIGSDNIKKEFLAVGYTIKNCLEITTISYEQYIEAVAYKMGHYSSLINFYKVKERIYDWDWKIVYQSIEEFLNSKSNSEYAISSYYYGEDALKRIIILIKKAKDKNPYDILKIIRAYLEHCYFFAILLYKIKDKTKDIQESIDEYINWESKKNIWIGIAIKYYITKEDTLIKKIIANFQEMIDKEINIIHKIKDVIKMKMEQ